MRFAVLLLAGLLATPRLSAQHPVPSDGQWMIGQSRHLGKVHLNIRYGEGGHSSNWGRTVPQSELVLAAAEMNGSGATATSVPRRPGSNSR